MARHPEKVRENRARRRVERRGLVLVKSRRRDPAAGDYGRYWVRDGRRVLAELDGLAAVEGWLEASNR
jgi:hypothetical protein